MVATINQSEVAAATSIAVNGQQVDGQPPAANGQNGHTKGRAESRRASNQSKELSDMDLPDPSRLNEQSSSTFTRPTIGEGGLLSADLEPSPLVRSIPSSPYLGSTTPTGQSTARFTDTDKQDALVEKLEKLELPEPEIFDSASKRATEERNRVATEFGEVWSSLDLLPDPEYITRAAMRAQGAKTPEPTPQSPGEPIDNATALRRHSSVKKPSQRNRQ